MTETTTDQPAQNLPLRERTIDIFFIVIFSFFTITSLISDLLPTIGMNISPTSTNLFAKANWSYAHDADPMFAHPDTWLRFATGLSAFVYMPFYIVLVYCLITARNWIQLYCVIYASMIASITGVVIFGAEFFNADVAMRTHNPAKFLAFNLPYVLIPILLLIRMRKPFPFRRRF